MKSWMSAAYRRREIEEALMRELRGVVYRFKRTGPRMETCETPQVRGNEGELCGGISFSVSLSVSLPLSV